MIHSGSSVLQPVFALLPALLKPDDVVFIKASRSVGLEHFATTLATA